MEPELEILKESKSSILSGNVEKSLDLIDVTKLIVFQK